MGRILKAIFLLLSVIFIFGVFMYCKSVHSGYYVLTLEGSVRKAQTAEFGLPYEDIKFLSNFTGKIIDYVPGNSSELRAEIKKAITNGYEEKKSILSKKMASNAEREKLIAYMLLRVNGSIPIYKPLDWLPPNDMTLLLVSDKGACLAYAVRLLMLLDVFGIQGRAVIIWTPSIYGHVIVDAYDPVEKKAYLLDPNFNVLSKFEGAKKGFFDILFSTDMEKRKEYFEQVKNIIFFPFYTVGTENIEDATNEFRERMYLTISDKWLTTLTLEMPQIIDGWKKRYPSSPNLVSMNLMDYMNYGCISEFKRFDIQSPLPTASLWKRAGKFPLDQLTVCNQ